MNQTSVPLKYVASLKRYTVAHVQQWNLLKLYNVYPIDHPDYFWNHHSAFVTKERVKEIAPLAAKDGISYSFIN